MPKISIIIPVFNSMRYLGRSLPSVVEAMEDFRDTELILVDNGSTDGSYEVLQSEYAGRAKILQIKGVTISTLRNQGARMAHGEYLSYIDSDFVIPRDYFHRAMNVFAAVQADASGCYCSLPPDAHWIEETWHFLLRRRVNTFVPYLFAGNFIIKKDVFDRIGGFDEKLVTGEDTELGLRLNTLGFRVYVSPEMAAIHLGNPKTLGEFFRKHTWHGLGMFGSLKWSWLDKPLLMTFAYLGLTAAGAANLFLGRLPWRWRVVLSAGLLLAAPAASVAYRYFASRTFCRPVRSLLLYEVYLAARSYALFKVAWARLRGREPRR